MSALIEDRELERDRYGWLHADELELEARRRREQEPRHRILLDDILVGASLVLIALCLLALAAMWGPAY